MKRNEFYYNSLYGTVFVINGNTICLVLHGDVYSYH